MAENVWQKKSAEDRTFSADNSDVKARIEKSGPRP